MSTINIFAPITKSERSADGHLSVYGMATGPQLDLDGQVCDADWLKGAMPAWFETGANVREMHQASAVGVGTELEAVGDDHWLTAKVVDPLAITKTETGVYTGFSIGIKSPKIVKDANAPHGRIVGGTIVEVSLVDRPCNESAKLVLAKMVGADLLEVEEIAKDATLDTDGSGLDPDEGDEVDLLAAARAAILALLAGETTELVNGEGSTGPVSILLSLLGDLDWFENADAYDDMQAALCAMKTALIIPIEEPEMLTLTTVADLVKAASAHGATADDTAAVAELRKALGIDDVDTKIATALTKTATAEELQGLADRLVKVENTASSSGPVRVNPQPTGVATEAIDRLNKAAHFRRLADSVTDREQAAAYRTLANQLDPQSL